MVPIRRFSNILFCPLGRRENSLAVRNLARLVDGSAARLTLFGVIPEPSGLRQLLPRPEAERALRDQQRGELERDLAKWGRGFEIPSVEVVTELGNPALDIVARVISHGHDLLVVTTDDERSDRATIKRLLRKCPCPVWVMRPTRARICRVMAAVDPVPDNVELNALIVELAASMTEIQGGELHVVHAWELFGESTLRSSAFVQVSDDEIDELCRREEDARREALEQLLARPGVAAAPWQIHVVKGPASEVIPPLAERLRINLLVMGTVARSGLSGLVMGNTAENILDQLQCSMLALKPPGFVSPLARST